MQLDVRGVAGSRRILFDGMDLREKRRLESLDELRQLLTAWHGIISRRLEALERHVEA